MTFQEIADWFTSKGKDYKKHETIIHAVNKTLEENYYQGPRSSRSVRYVYSR